MENMCQVEYIVSRGFDDPCCSSIPERLMSVNGLALIGTGALSCVRALYNASVRVSRQHQFFHCGITKEEYAAGTYGPKILAAINKALSCKNTRYVVIYASCLEILAQMDFDRLIAMADNPRNIPIRLLKRGPLMKRHSTLRDDVNSILSEIKAADEPILQNNPELPPLFPDYNSIAAMLQNWDAHIFLTTAGGCGGALMDTGSPDKPYHISHSRLSDVQIALGCDTLLENGIRNDRIKHQKPLSVLLGSTTLGFTGLNCEGIASRLEKSGYPSLYSPSDGFTPGPVGASEAALLLGKKLFKSAPKDSSRVNILGYNPMVFTEFDKIYHGLEHLEKLGLKGEIQGSGSLSHAAAAPGAALNWVVSAEGLELAQYMEKEFHIPYISGVPVGGRAMQLWQNRIKGLLGICSEPLSEEPAPLNSKQPKITVIGEPLLNESICSCLEKEFGFVNSHSFVYTPDMRLKLFYQSLLPDNFHSFFASAEELLKMAEGSEIIIADPTYKEYLGNKQALFIPIPYPLLSGRRFHALPYEIIGKKGARYLSDAIANINL